MITISEWEYNCLMNELAVLNRAMQLILEERGVYDLHIGNTHVYLALGGGCGGAFTDENGDWLRSLDYALAEHGAVSEQE